MKPPWKNKRKTYKKRFKQCAKRKSFLTIYLMSGVKLSGRIRSFDKYSVVLESNNQEQLILSTRFRPSCLQSLFTVGLRTYLARRRRAAVQRRAHPSAKNHCRPG